MEIFNRIAYCSISNETSKAVGGARVLTGVLFEYRNEAVTNKYDCTLESDQTRFFLCIYQPGATTVLFSKFLKRNTQ